MGLNQFDDALEQLDPSTAPGPANPYDALLDERDAATTLAVRQSMRQAAPISPTRAADVQEISKQSGLPIDLVNRAYDDVRKRADLTSNPYDAILLAQDHPAVAAWVAQHPTNAAIARDELTPLGQLEQSSRQVSAAPTFTQQMYGALDTGYNDLVASAYQLGVAYGAVDPKLAAGVVANANAKAAARRAELPDYVKEFQATMAQKSAALNTALDTFRGLRGSVIVSTLDKFKAGFYTIGEALDLIRAAAMRPRGLLYANVEGLPAMAPMLAGGAAGAETGAALGSVIEPGGGTLVGGAIGGLGGAVGTFVGTAPVVIGQDINQRLAARGVDVTNADALERAYANPALMAEIRSQAQRKGLTNAAVVALVSSFAGKASAIAKESSLPVRAVAGATDVGVQAAGMSTAQLAGETAAGEKPNVGGAVQTGISTLAFSVAEATLGAARRGVFSRDPVTAATEAMRRADDALSTEQNAQALAAIGDAVKAAPTTARVPEHFKAIIDTATGGNEATAVYFRPEAWDTYWQSAKTSPADAASEIMGDGGQAYYAAKATDTPLAIPLGDYVAKVATTPAHWDGLLPAARMTPDGMTLGEAREYLQTLPSTLKTIADEATGQSPETPATQVDTKAETAARVRADVEEQLRTIGVAPSQAKAHAQLLEAGFRTLAERVGRDPHELYQRYLTSIGRVDEAPVTTSDTTLEQQPSPEFVPVGGEGEENADRRAAQAQTDASTPLDESRLLPADQVRRDLQDQDMRRAASALEARARDVQAARASRPRSGEPTTLEQDARGRIRIGPNREMAIELSKHADPSTFIHETGHLYVEVLHDLAAAADAPDELKADLGTLRAWVKAEGDTPLTREQHEQIARGFEAYLMEGKAPSNALRGVFYRFKQWLLKIYSQLADLHADLTPDVRRVFDRLLASREEIAQAEASAGVEPLFDDPRAVGMTEADATAYAKAVAEARQSAEEHLTAKLMQQMRREQSKEWAAWRAPIEAAVTEEIDAAPLYRAMAVLKDGTTPDGAPLPEGVEPLKLHRETVKAMTAITPEQAAALVRQGVTSDDGVHPDVAAEAFGFTDGNALVKALATMPDRATAIDAETDARMQAQHGDPLTEEKLRTLATDAVRNDQRVRVLRTELEVLASEHLATLKGLVRAVTKAVPPTEEIRRQARTIVDQTLVGALRPAVFEASASRAGHEAREALLRGDVTSAFEAKRKQILAVELARVAQDTRTSIDAALDGFKELRKSDATIAETRDLDLVNAARSILGQFGIPTAESRASASLEQLKQYDPGAYDYLRETIRQATIHAGPYRSVSAKDFLAMASTVDALWSLARQVETLDVKGERLKLADVRQRVLDQIHRFNKPEAKPGYTKAVSRWERAKVGLLGFKARMRRVEDWVTVVDNGREGIARDAIFQPVNEGAVRYDAARVEIARRYAELAKALDIEHRYRDIAAPELNYTFKDKHQELLGALLHLGNGFEPGSNGYKLLVGRGWGEPTPDGGVDVSRWKAFEARMQHEGLLTKRDYDFVQAVWDLNESVKPAAQQAHKARFGRYFDEVTAVPFETQFGHYDGGYYPAVVDPFVHPLGADRADARALLEGDVGGAGMFPSVSHGFTKTRLLTYAKPLILDASMVLSHLNAVLRFAHLSEPVHGVARLVLHPTFRSGAEAIDPATVSDLLKPFLDRAASQRMYVPMEGKAGRAADAIARAIRTRGVMQVVALNATVLAEQVTHFVSVLAHPDVDGTKVLGALWRLSREPRAMAEDVHGLSPFMATRESAGLVEAHAAIDRVLLDPTPAQRAGRWVSDHTTVVMRTIQAAMDLATWQAVYDKIAEEPGSSSDRAVQRADAAVRQTLGSYRPQDRAAIEGGNQMLGLLNLLYGFYGTKANMLGTEAVLASRMGLQRQFSRAFAIYALGFMAPALLGKGIKVAMGSKPFTEHDEDDAHALLRFWWDAQEEMAIRMVPFAGAAADQVVQSFNKGRARELLNSPAVAMVEEALHAPGETYHALADRHATEAQKAKARTDIFTLLGLLSNLPMRPVGQAVNVATDQAR
jgi:hypothetical protein